jgi:thiol-disulfide isomerase/thioredoxin
MVLQGEKIRSLTIILGLVFCWTMLSGADEWDMMHISKFNPRREPPKVSLKTLDGKSVSLSDYKGKVVFLNFWTTWCGYCKHEMPSMEKLYKKFKEKGFIVVAVDVRESAEKVKAFWDRYELTFPAVLDPTGMAAMAFGLRGYPGSFFIDRNGNVVGSAPGARDWFSEEAQAIVSRLLEEEGPKGHNEAKNEKYASGVTETEETVPQPEKKAFPLSSIAGPAARAKGQMTVKSTQIFDLDEGTFGNEKTADFSWSEVGFTTRYLIPQNGAEFANKGVVDQVTFDDIVLSTYSGSPINGSEGANNRLKPGTIVYARTNEGRYACVRVESYGRDLDISWITYEKD